jgi:asparagine synthetase B (glutamine-hydrolysing)
MNTISGVYPRSLKGSGNPVLYEVSCTDIKVWAESESETPFINARALADQVEVCFVGYLEGLGSSAQKSAEVLLADYLAEGCSAFSGKFGSFVALVIDRRNDSYFLLCDSSNQRRWYYYHHENCFVFSTKLKQCASLLPGKADLQQDNSFFWVYGFYPYNQTAYKDIYSLSGNKYAVFSKGKLSIKDKKHWIAPDVSAIESEKTAVDVLEALLLKSIEQNAGVSSKVGVLLGGFDSALVASLLKRCGREVETFSFYYDEVRYNQAHTDTLAEYLGIKHHWVKIDAEVIKTGLQNYADTFDQPTNWPNYLIQTEFLARHIKKQGVDVCVTGDGCDNLFYGYPGVFKNAKLYSRLGNVPRPLLNIAEFCLRGSFQERWIGHPYRLALRLLRNMGKALPARAYLMFRIFDELTVTHLFGKDLAQVKADVKRVEDDICKDLPDKSAAWLAYQGKAAISPNRAKLVGSSDSADLALFSPYMDSRVKAFVASLPENLLRPTGATQDIGKYILTKMAEEKGYLPAEVIYQPKLAAVDAPIDDWYRAELKPITKEIITSGFVNISPSGVDALLQETLFEKIYKKYFDTADNLTTHVLSLLVTQSAYRLK